ALDELDVLDARGLGVRAREVEHLVGHVEPDRLAVRSDPAGGDQHVGAGARSEVKDNLALVERSDGCGDTTTEGGVDRGSRARVGLVLVIERAAEDLLVLTIGEHGVPVRAAAALAGADCAGGFGVAFADGLADLL